MDLKNQRSSRSQARRLSQRRSKGEDKSEPAFVCTICWRPQHPPSKPKLLGSSARIICRSCWKAVLNLSICWVCGEYIVRGDEVVSLGWCFWHKSCFGCLVCGTKMSVPILDEDEGKIIGKGVELEAVPLCGVCSVELSGETEGMVLEKGVENVSRFDGGLSRERLQRWSEVGNEGAEPPPEDRSLAHQDSLKQNSRGCPRCSNQPRPTANTGNLHAMLHSAIDTRISGDGNADEYRREDWVRELPPQAFANDERPDVYLSIFDPIGEAAFKPSRTKPLPKWMHLLPSNIHREKEQNGKGLEDQATLETSAEASVWSNSATKSSAQVDNRYSRGPTLSGSVTQTTPQTQSNVPTPPMDIPNAKPNARTSSKITFEPYPEIEPAEGGHRGDRRSHTVESAYMTPPEYPRPKTPFPRPARPFLSRRETSSFFLHKPSESSVKDPWEVEDMCCDLALTPRAPTPTPELTSAPQLLSPPLTQQYKLLPSQSCEYLERYQPKSATTKHEKYVAKDPEPILSKLKRQRVGNQNLEQVAGERRLKRHGERARSPRLEAEDYGVDPRRKDLNRELRNLFCEE